MSVIKLDQRLFSLAALGALGVIAGVVAKNTSEQMVGDEVFKERLGNLGLGLFLVGWVLVGHTLATKLGNPYEITAWAPVVGIVGSVLLMKQMMKDGKQVGALLPGVFALSWIALGVRAGFGNNQDIGVGVLLAALVIGSMLFVLPWQRKFGVVDGPGLPMFTVAWVLLSYLIGKK